MLSALALATIVGIKTATISSAGSPQQLAIHCVEPTDPGSRIAVLFIHGSSFPTLLASGYQFHSGDSWLHSVAAQGYLACGVDFPGFGQSSQPPALSKSPDASPPFLRAADAVISIQQSVDYLRTQRSIRSIHVVAHSWGTLPALTYAAQHGNEITSLTIFGPVVPLSDATESSEVAPAWFALDVYERLEQLHFRALLPSGSLLLDRQVDERWARELAASGQHVNGDPPDVVRVPAGPLVDIEAAEAGRYAFDPQDVRVPLFAVYGSYDSVVDDVGAARFMERFTNAPIKWRLRIDNGTHVLHLESNRHSLYEAVAAFVRVTESRR